MYLNDRQVQHFRSQILEAVQKCIGIKAVCDLQYMPSEYGVTFFIREVDSRGPVVAQFSMSHMPGCCGIIVSHGTVIAQKYIGKKLGTELHKIKLEIAKMLNFSSMLCTDVASGSHAVQRKILDKNEWQEVAKFNNLNSGNNVSVFFKNLRVDLKKEQLPS
jgi:hypothetical protein